ncbi:nuclease-related domain-containing protein [Patulibacter sp. NPDC049589]|uniref:nuclease-related domain-containing protein n=1 Tax=Patulibacter sp. NPDC049589 TaxID=3154731 RepID=UPI00344A7F40
MTVAIVVAVIVVLACAGIALVSGPLGADGATAEGGGERATPLRAQTERDGNGVRVTVTGRVRTSDGTGPAVVHVLGRTVGTSCPEPTVAGDGTIDLPPGDVRIPWRVDAGTAPGVKLPTGRRIRMVGRVVTPAAVRNLCVHVVLGGAEPGVLRSVEVAVPNLASPGPGVNSPLVEDAIVLALVVVIVVALVAGILAIGVIEARRRGSTWALPALPADVRIPDVIPADDPRADASRGRLRLRAIRERRLQRWRDKRRKAAEASGEPWDPHEKPPRRLAIWGVGDGAGRLAAERFRALRDMHPAVEALHDRRVPGPRGATIDHVFVGPAGIVVASSSRWDGFVEVRGDRLVVAGKDRSRTIDGVVGRVEAVRALLDHAGMGGLPIRGVLHCVVTEDVLLDGSLRVRDVPLLDALGTMGLAADGNVLGYEDVRRLVAALERRLPPVG